MARKPIESTQESTQVSESNIQRSDLHPDTAVITVTRDGQEPILFRWTELPFTSQYRLAKGGVAHMLQNEVASQVVSAIRRELGHNAKTNPITGADGKARIAAYREANPDKISEFETAFTAEKVKAIREGTLLDRAIVTREPARSPVDRLALAKMGVAVEAAFKKMAEKKAQLGIVFTWKASDVLSKVKDLAATDAMARYRAQAQAELDAAGSDELDVGELLAAE